MHSGLYRPAARSVSIVCRQRGISDAPQTAQCIAMPAVTEETSPVPLNGHRYEVSFSST